MNSPPAQYRRPVTEQGYAYLLVMFLLALLIVGTMASVPNVLIEGRREKEEEMIWRGNQYVRAIRLYTSYRANGSHRLPTSLEALTKGTMGVHFLRQAYKDPMNKKDGSWRLIYVGPSGQLIGSTRPQKTNLVIPGSSAPIAPSAGALQNQPGTNPNGPLSLTGPLGVGGPTATSSPATAPASPNENASSNTQPVVPPDGVTLIGGNIIGIGSKINQKSIIWYDGAKNYREFEFIWDPSKDVALAVQPSTGLTPGLNGANSFSVQPNGQILVPSQSPSVNIDNSNPPAQVPVGPSPPNPPQ
ncbi:MAG: hypothetical protein PVS2B2_14420 [Candidatus Acidiferrum sp.]